MNLRFKLNNSEGKDFRCKFALARSVKYSVFFISLVISPLIYSQNNSLELKLIPDSDSTNNVSSNINFSVILENNSEDKFSIIDRPRVLDYRNPGYFWIFQVYNLANLKQYVEVHFEWGTFPDKNEYIIINPKNSYKFSFKIDFNKLKNSVFDLTENNNDHGDYSLQLYYFDHFQKSKFAVKDTLWSNKIIIHYKE